MSSLPVIRPLALAAILLLPGFALRLAAQTATAGAAGTEDTADTTAAAEKSAKAKNDQQLSRCGSGMAESCDWLARLHLARGEHDQARQFGEKGCTLGKQDSCELLQFNQALLYPDDSTGAVKFLTGLCNAAKKKNKSACAALPEAQSEEVIVVPAPSAAAAADQAPPNEANPDSTRPGDFVERAELDIDPREVFRPTPEIPTAAISRQVSGTVFVLIFIDQKGGISSATLSRGIDPDYGLNQTAVEAALKMRFQPGIKNGVPVKTSKIVSFLFKRN